MNINLSEQTNTTSDSDI